VCSSDLLKTISMNLNDDDPNFYKLPESREITAQYLLLYEMSLPFGLDLNNQINIDKSSTRVTALAEPMTTKEIIDLDLKSRNWLGENFSNDSLKATGIPVMFAYIFQRNIDGMLTGTTIAFLLISFVLIIAYKSLKIGLISLIPNLLPAALTFGVWSIFVGEVGLASSIIVATSLGIIVDDTVHFLTKYNQSRVEGHSVEESIRQTFNKVGVALISTSLILVAGFLVLSFSSFKLNQHLGLMMSLAISFALITDFLLLPTLLIWLDKIKKVNRNEN